MHGESAAIANVVGELCGLAKGFAPKPRCLGRFAGTAAVRACLSTRPQPLLNAAAVPAEGAWNCFRKEKSRSGKRFPMPDTHETEAPRRWGGEPPHVSDAPHISPDV